jgi:hypothetical protein
MMTKATPENEEGDTHLCAVNVAREWFGDRREIVGSEPCGHPASRHDASMCYACDEEGSTAGMLHAFSSILTDDTGWLAADDPRLPCCSSNSAVLPDSVAGATYGR